jgi:hypothetical protein
MITLVRLLRVLLILVLVVISVDSSGVHAACGVDSWSWRRSRAR